MLWPAQVDAEEASMKRRGVPDPQRELFKYKKVLKVLKKEKKESPVSWHCRMCAMGWK